MQSIVAIGRPFKSAQGWYNLVIEFFLAINASQKGEKGVDGVQQRLQHFQIHGVGAPHENLKSK